MTDKAKAVFALNMRTASDFQLISFLGILGEDNRPDPETDQIKKSIICDILNNRTKEAQK